MECSIFTFLRRTWSGAGCHNHFRGLGKIAAIQADSKGERNKDERLIKISLWTQRTNIKGIEGRFTYLKTKTGIKVSAKKHKKISKTRHPIRILIGGGFLLHCRLFFEGGGKGVPDLSMKLPFLI